MNSLDLVIMALKNLFRRKLRTSLTVLGIIIGTISIVIMISLGIGMKESYKQEISRNMGSLNIITIRPSYGGEGGIGGFSKKRNKSGLNDEDVKKLSDIQGVEAVSPMYETNGKIVAGKYSLYANLVGIDPEKMASFDFKIDKGRLLNKSDKLNLVFGGETPFMFYNPNEMRGRQSRHMEEKEERKPKVDILKENNIILTFDMSYGEKRPQVPPKENTSDQNKKPAEKYKIKAVGLLSNTNYENNWKVYMPLNELRTLKQKYDKSQNGSNNPYNKNADNGYSSILVKIKDIKNVKEIQKKIKSLGYEAYSPIDMLESVQKTQNIIQMVLGGIGGVALLVAAIGIANTMVMAIYERKKEIGVMKVIGASIKDIRRLFLLESAMIGLIGGVIGLALCFLISKGINVIAAKSMHGALPEGSKLSLIPYWLAGVSVLFTSFVGIAAGFLPAVKATKLSALDAIRNE